MSQHPTMTTHDQPVTPDAVRREAKDWVLHIATGEATEAEFAALQRWCAQSPRHAEAYAQACRLWSALGEPLESSMRSALRVATLRSATTPQLGRRAFLGGAVAVTAAAAGAMAVRPPFELWPSLDELGADYRTAAGEQRRIALPSQVTIEMNTRTSLSLRTEEATAETIEIIAGEAAVATKARSVVVRAGDGRISATHAQFTVRSDANEVRVTCLGGLTDVAYRGQSVSVGPRQQVTYVARGLGAVVPVDTDVVAGWREGLLVFQNERLAHVIDEVNRYRAGRIVLVNKELGERRVSARFKIARLDAVLTQFREVFGAKVTSFGAGFVLMS